MAIELGAMGEARGHHFVSQCYLKGFTANGSKKSKLYAVDLTTGASFWPLPKNVAKQRDFNAIDGLPPAALENALSGFEARVTGVLKRIVENRAFTTEDDWLHVINFIALLAIRNPRMRESVRQFEEDSARLMMEAAVSSRERWESIKRQMKNAGAWNYDDNVTYEQLRDFVKEKRYVIEVPNARHIYREFALFNKFLPFLVARKWSLCVASDDSEGFITSDHPVCLIWSDGEFTSFLRPVGFGLTNTTVLFPLSREVLAVGTFEGAHGAVRTLSPFQVAFFNGYTCANAERQVYAASDRFRVLLGRSTIPIRGTDVGALSLALKESAE